MKSQKKITLSPINNFSGTVTLPGSKSVSNRVLLLSMLAEGETEIHNLLDSEDIRYMIEGMKKLGIRLKEDRKKNIVYVSGASGKIPSKKAHLMLGNAGTAMRPLTAAVTLGKGEFFLDGIPRMRKRPIIDLVRGLRQLGANLDCTNENDCPPLNVKANGLPGGTSKLSGAISSQYLTSILLVSPYAKKEVRVEIFDKLVSKPYVDMTINLMKLFGVFVDNKNYEIFIIPKQNYVSPGKIFVEGDASSASYFLAGAAITNGTITVNGCGDNSIQGDILFANILEKMGARVKWGKNKITLTGSSLIGIDVDMNEMPDAAMTLAVTAMFAKGKTTIRNIYNWRFKETERLYAVCKELRKLGAIVEKGNDYLEIKPPENIKEVSIDTYEDHRMAMAFSLAACGNSSITINNPNCVRKTYPNYFEVFKGLCQ